jgi:hypothetical protein
MANAHESETDKNECIVDVGRLGVDFCCPGASLVGFQLAPSSSTVAVDNGAVR